MFVCNSASAWSFKREIVLFVVGVKFLIVDSGKLLKVLLHLKIVKAIEIST